MSAISIPTVTNGLAQASDMFNKEPLIILQNLGDLV